MEVAKRERAASLLGPCRSHFPDVLDLNCASRNTQCASRNEVSRHVLTYLRIDRFENRGEILYEVQQFLIGGYETLRSESTSMAKEMRETLGIFVAAFDCRIDVGEQLAPRLTQLVIRGVMLQCDRGSLRGAGRG